MLTPPRGAVSRSRPPAETRPAPTGIASPSAGPNVQLHAPPAGPGP
ncbi:hypothetical protein Ae406Ps2_6414 [Pseudonocardia sp. Ae406_Ps2]|nr:hypothetical protein Ae406Ps2_6414 [Pseudonocardia sp. Ae406_Ps2]